MSEDDKPAGKEEVQASDDLPEIEQPRPEPKPKIKPPKTDATVKRDVAFLQKKMAELEIAVSEAQENLQKIDVSGVDEFKQRVSDVEDLVMVENAAVIELKKMLEATKPEQPPPQETKVDPQMEEKIKSLEEKISGITVPNVEEIKSSISSSLPAMDTTKVDQTANELKTAFDNLKKELAQKLEFVEERFSNMEHSLATSPGLEDLKTDLKHEILSSLPDYDLIRADVQSTVETLKSNMEQQKASMRSTLDTIKEQLDRPLPERAVEELEGIKNDWLVNNAKLEAVQKFVENFSNELNALKPVMAKLETFDKLLDLHEEITDKLESYKELQEHMEDAVERSEDVEKRIHHDANRLKETSKQISKIEENMSALAKEISKVKKGVFEIADPMQDRISSIDDSVSHIQDEIAESNKRFDSVEANIEKVQDDMSVFQGSLMSLEQSKADFTAVISDLQETIKRNNKQAIVKKIEDIEAEIDDIKSLKPDDPTNELVDKINELEERIESVRTSTIFNDQMNEIVSRLVFLESRLAAFERVLQDMPKYSPIVVE